MPLPFTWTLLVRVKSCLRHYVFMRSTKLSFSRYDCQGGTLKSLDRAVWTGALRILVPREPYQGVYRPCTFSWSGCTNDMHPAIVITFFQFALVSRDNNQAAFWWAHRPTRLDQGGGAVWLAMDAP